MLEVCGAASLDDLIREAIPPKIIDPSALEDNVVGDPIPEHIFLQNIKSTLEKNKNYTSYLGCGFYPSIIPTVIQRNLL